MSEGKLKTAVLGLDDKGKFLLEVISQIDYFQIAAVADTDATLAESTGYKYKCDHYDDYRQLIMQNQFDCLLVAAGVHSCDEYIKMAMKKKTNILKLAPLARNFQEAAEFVHLAEDENIKFAIANPHRFARSYLALQEFLQQGRIEQIFLITAFCAVGNEQAGTWQTDPKLAGGGVLLRNCYQIIDQIVWSIASPQQVYSLNTNTAGDRQQRSYLTEDTAVVTMKFTDTFFGNLIASRVFGSEQEVLKVYGKDKILTVSNTRFAISDGLGQTNEESAYDDDELIWYTALLKNFALSILLPDKNKLCSSGRENLKDMAVIEASYLSARTSMPEEPGRILKMAQTEPINILPVRK
ncbi:MAG: Gfo/Idh/MocA family oxidoreductase [Phycisphaerae bacterium]|nr:Gfo/Idh/MocA family oxidoreductase [Phycisphaerae bacterium]MDD5381457.1 Gfo/Idh/MocA family oxidoreductase [Phycisphaerae bacterium]